MFGCNVGRLEWRCDKGVGRGDVDDASPFAFLHPGHVALIVWKAAERLMAMMASHFSSGNDLNRGDVLNAGVVDQHVDNSKFRYGRGDERGNSCLFGDVSRVIAHLGAMGSCKPLAQNLGFGGGPRAVEHHVHAGSAQRLGDAEADAAGRAGDQCGSGHERLQPSCLSWPLILGEDTSLWANQSQ